MKKLICVIISLLIMMCLTGCGLHSDDDNPTLDIHENAAYDGKLEDTTKAISDEDSFIFTWLTYSELRVTPELKNESDYKSYISDYFINMKEIGVTDCFVHIRPFADSMYPSEAFPLSVYSENAADFDPFGVIIEAADEYDIKIHAWINPYRISNDPEYDISDNYESYENDIIRLSSGVYFNPASLKIQELILRGVEEVLIKYDIAGIHIDDYFYPADIKDEDKTEYDEYKKQGGKKTLSQWRRENVNSLVSAMYLKVRAFGEDKIFSISPGGNIQKNYNQLYADVSTWCKGGYCHMIIPQIYFGFENETLPFEECLESWLEITDKSETILIPALALYKSGKEDIFAGSGKIEWQKNSDIISRQVNLIKDKALRGFALYSASYINFSETFTSEELNNLKSVL